jgi:hypothetical protein
MIIKEHFSFAVSLSGFGIMVKLSSENESDRDPFLSIS